MNDDDELHLRERLLYIDQMIAQTHNLYAESRKLMAEQDKFYAEMRKLTREVWWYPALAIAGVVGGLLGLATFIAKLIH